MYYKSESHSLPVLGQRQSALFNLAADLGTWSIANQAFRQSLRVPV